MPSPIILPVPLSWTSLSPGQLLVDPLNPSSTFSSPTSSAPLNDPLVQFNYTDDLTHDAEGRLISSVANRTWSPHDDPESVIHLQAERSQYNSLQSPAAAFGALCHDSSTQDYFHKAAMEGRPLYYVTAVQTLTNPSFKKTASHSPIPSPPHDSQTKLFSYERRDSALSVSEPGSAAILGVELRKVRCLVGSPVEPHSLEDIDYAWTYHRLGEDTQLSIGLGKALQAAEFRRLANIIAEEDFSDGEYDVGEDGYGGF